VPAADPGSDSMPTDDADGMAQQTSFSARLGMICFLLQCACLVPTGRVSVLGDRQLCAVLQCQIAVVVNAETARLC
jgi:hypothetical protein